MSAIGKYFIQGKFEGHFTTNQKKALNASDLLPEGHEHTVKIYRGLITESTQISQSAFEESNGYYHFKRINNIQINTSPNWPVPNDRIFSLNDLKLTQVQITNVDLFDNKTSGIIRGNVIGSVAEGTFDESIEKEPYNPGKAAKPFPTSGQESDDQDVTSGGKGNGGSNSTGSNSGSTVEVQNEPWLQQGCNRIQNQGCNSRWLRWLLLLLLLFLLLYLLAKCTQVGRNIYCKLDNSRIEQKIVRTKEEIKLLREKIRNTEPQAQACGGKIDHSGKNNYWDQRFNIGMQSGLIEIDFNALHMPDRLEVIYDGKLVAETNCKNIKGYPELNGKGFQQDSIRLTYAYKYDIKKPTELLLRVIPNKDEPSTEWTINLNCPR
jgi:hypothetical protein